MTDDQVWTQAVQWVKMITGIATVIRAYEDGLRPALPYIMVNFTGSADVREWPLDMEYTPDPGDPAAPVTVAPVMETEWRFSVHSYGLVPTDLLRPMRSARHVAQMHESIRPLNVFDVGNIRRVPEYVNEKWEPRANVDLILRGLTRDGFVIDTIDDIEPFILTREGTA